MSISWGLKVILGACFIIVFGVGLIYFADYLNSLFGLVGESLVP